MDIQIELIPVNEERKEKNTFLIPLAKAEYLAFLASSLTPMDALSEIEGYTNALWEYMQEKRYQEKELFLAYDHLIHANRGYQLLSCLTELFLLEKEMRNSSLKEESIRRYNFAKADYLSILSELQKK